MAKPTLLYEDSSLVVLSKPAGLLSQGDNSKDPNLVDWLRKYWGQDFVGLVHRLDRNTSGLMVVAKNSRVAKQLTDALVAGQISRVYLAWVKGFAPEQFEYKHFLLKDERKNTVYVRNREVPGSKMALLSGRVLEKTIWCAEPVSLVEITLDTGRSHQIRVQLAQEGFPLLGDSKYTNEREYAPRFSRTALHSYFLNFSHPTSKEKMDFKDPLPRDLSEIMPTSAFASR